MGGSVRRAIWLALCAGLFALSATAEQITLTGPGFETSGAFLGYDGRFYRLETDFGEITVDGQGLSCSGAVCPDPRAPVLDLRLSGEASLARKLLPALANAYARSIGARLEQHVDAEGRRIAMLRDGIEPILRIVISGGTSDESFADLLANQADLVLSLREIRPLERQLIIDAGYGDLTGLYRSRVLALDALVPIVAPGNPVTAISLPDLARVLAGDITNWADLGGSNAPITLHLPAKTSALGQVIEDRLMQTEGVTTGDAVTRHSDITALASAVTQDANALGLTSFLDIGAASALALSGPCGFTIGADRYGVKSEDYPLTLPVVLYQPARRLPAAARDFLHFLRSTSAQLVIRRLGFVDQTPEDISIALQGMRLANAITAPGADLDELQRMVTRLRPFRRLTTSFRFEPGSSRLDAQSRSNVLQLGRALQSGKYDGREILFAGFSTEDADPAIARVRAETIRQAVLQAARAKDLRAVTLSVDAFGPALPIACDDTAWGRQSNRRVETWVR